MVTGASAGIGQETAILLSNLGAKLVLIATNEERLQNTMNMLVGNGHKYFCYDLADLENKITKSIFTDIYISALIAIFKKNI